MRLTFETWKKMGHPPVKILLNWRPVKAIEALSGPDGYVVCSSNIINPRKEEVVFKTLHGDVRILLNGKLVSHDVK